MNRLMMRSRRRSICVVVGTAGLLLSGLSTSSAAESIAEDETDYALDSRYSAAHVTSSYTTEYGEVIDCVDARFQPGMIRAGLAGQQVETAPLTMPVESEGGPIEPGLTDNDRSKVGVDTVLDAPAARCSEGSVPILRRSARQLETSQQLALLKTMPGTGDWSNGADGGSTRRDGATDLHQYAAVYRNVSNWGAESNLNVWQPYLMRRDEFSLSQIWVSRGSGADRETVEAGWQKYHDLYGDWRSHLFIYFTPDNYGSGGCYNLDCSGFVQTNNSIVIGGTLGPVSTLGGPQYSIRLLLYKDGTTGHWWLRYGTTWVGYWPRDLFDSRGLRNRGARVTYGGEIIDVQAGGQHTRTDMGSGRFPSTGFGQAAYQRKIRYVDTSNYYRHAGGTTSIVTDRFCYHLAKKRSTDSNWKRYFYFGGSGRNSSCQ
jgi:hypothetical protein